MKPWFAVPLILAAAASTAHAEPRNVGSFHAIEITGTIQVEATIAPTAHVEVLGEAERLHQVKTDVKNGSLIIATVGDVKGARLRVVVSAPALDALAISGAATLSAAGLTGDRLAVRIGGTGEITLGGKVGTLALEINGAGAVHAKGLATTDAAIAIGGTGEVSANVTRSLVASITGTGAIKVHGKPTSIKKAITGVGVIKTVE